jgi:beta-phosphoglucomutase-like phosphatase (HAD superfamily)
MTELAAVLWDMDGTLVDTEPYWIECEQRLVEEYGGTWSDEQAAALIGSDLLDSAATLRRAGVDMEPVALVNRLMDGVIEGVQRELPWRPGARELLAACRDASVPCVLVTMSWRRFADAVLLSAPAGSFVATITGDEVTKGKPHPEPYLAAARVLGVDPRCCVAIEDSRTGVASALAAGCATLGVPHVVTLDPAPNLTIAPTLDGVTVDDLRALLVE